MAHRNLVVPVVFSLVLFFIPGLHVGAGVWQDKAAPLSKPDLLALVRQSASRRLSQGEIIEQVEQRGISFAVDDATIAELKQAGARTFLIEALRRLGKNGGKPEDYPTGVTDETGLERVKADDLARLPLLEQARHNVLENAKELPNFVVNQKVSRYSRTAQVKDWQLDDTLELEITYLTDKGEQFNLLRVNGKPTGQSYEALGGSTSTGEFGSLLTAIFLPYSKTQFKEVSRETYRGRPTAVYSFRVLKANSTATIQDKSSGDKVVAGYSGSAWIDTESKGVLRIELNHTDLPARFAITTSENAIEYDWVTIGEQRYLLPVQAELLMSRASQQYSTRNVIEFSNYHKFEGKLKVLDQEQ